MTFQPNPTRRQCLAGLAAAAAAGTLRAAATPPRPPGVQLYAVRSLLGKEPDRALKALADIGYRDVEGFNRAGTVALTPKIKQYGLTLRSCQVETPLITADWENYPEFQKLSLPAAIDSVKTAGADYFAMGYISPGARGDGDDFYRRTADRMNVAAELCRKAGLKFAWPTHAFEFAGAIGHRPIDILIERIDPKLVAIELDVFWLSVAGLDPVRQLKEWKGRVALLRLQDKAKGTPRQFEEAIGEGAFTAAGSGTIDFAAILKAAPAAGVKYSFAGQDETADDPLESLRRSFDYLVHATSVAF